MKRLSIDPVTRVAGLCRIEIFLNANGEVANTYFQVPQFRGFNRFCVGRYAEEMPLFTSRICGMCPEAHHLASVKALDVIYNAPPPETALKIRELVYMTFLINDHATHFFVFGGPDFFLGPDAGSQQRNLWGSMTQFGRQPVEQFLACRKRNHQVLERLGGRGIHLVAGVPGGWSRQVKHADRALIREAALRNVDFALSAIDLFERVILNDSAFCEMLHDENFIHPTYSMGTVDAHNKVNFLDGTIRIVDPEGGEFARYQPEDYAEHIAEHVEPWTYLSFPYLKAVGWKGFQTGADSGIYCATPLARLNVSDGMTTPLAHAAYEKLYAYFGGFQKNGKVLPIHHRFATHWARLIELLYAAERMRELAEDEALLSSDIRTQPAKVLRRFGAGSVEAPRGTLIHQYEVDPRGIITNVTILTGTANNHAAMAMSVKRAAERYISRGSVIDRELLNRIEMALRLYDPCLACATHSDSNAVRVVVRDTEKQVVQEFTQ